MPAVRGGRHRSTTPTAGQYSPDCRSADRWHVSELRQALPGVSLMQVVHVTGEPSIAEAVNIAALWTAFCWTQEIGRCRSRNWEGQVAATTGRSAVESGNRLQVPVYLAGGLRPENVAEAMAVVRPFGLDICTGVRTNAHLDEAKLSEFFTSSRRPPPPTSVQPRRLIRWRDRHPSIARSVCRLRRSRAIVATASVRSPRL